MDKDIKWVIDNVETLKKESAMNHFAYNIISVYKMLRESKDRDMMLLLKDFVKEYKENIK